MASRECGMDMRRRDFLGVLSGSVITPLALPLVADAQQSERVRVIGYLGVTTPSDGSERTTAFVQRLRELGWIEGRNVAIEVRWAEGRGERYTEIAAEFARLKVDVIVTAGGAVLATKQATSVIPIVFAVANDPVGSGLVASLARPGGNVTGLSLQFTDIAGKRLEFLRETVPGLRRLGVMANISYPGAVLEFGRFRRWAVPSASKSPASKSSGRTTSHLYLRRSSLALTHFMSVPIRFLVPIGLGSTHWRSPHERRRCMATGNMLRPAV